MAFVAPALAAIGGGSVAAGAVTAASLAATAYSAVQASKAQKQAIPTPDKPPQATKTPERAALATNLAAAAKGSLSGNAGTFLTGPAGIAPDTLSLGKTTLLGR